MSRVYVMSETNTRIKQAVEKTNGPLSLFHRPLDEDGKVSLWPWAVTDGKNYGWFEGNMILFWGTNNELTILSELEKLRIYAEDSF